MFKNIVPITKEAHQRKKIKKVDSFAFAEKYHLASLMIHEFSRAASVYPIVFIEDKKTSEFRPVALLGLTEGENLFVNEKGKWEASYIPAIIRKYPFILANTDKENRFAICIDDTSDFVTEDEGEPLFQENGEPAEMMDRVKKYLGNLQGMEALTKRLCKDFKEDYLFTPLNMRVREADSVKNVTGAYVINEDKLNELPDEKFLKFKEQKVLLPIYSHIASIGQIERLLKLKSQKNDTNIQPVDFEEVDEVDIDTEK
jgi:hypothetical protein